MVCLGQLRPPGVHTQYRRLPADLHYRNERFAVDTQVLRDLRGMTAFTLTYDTSFLIQGEDLDFLNPRQHDNLEIGMMFQVAEEEERLYNLLCRPREA